MSSGPSELPAARESWRGRPTKYCGLRKDAPRRPRPAPCQRAPPALREGPRLCSGGSRRPPGGPGRGWTRQCMAGEERPLLRFQRPQQAEACQDSPGRTAAKGAFGLTAAAPARRLAWPKEIALLQDPPPREGGWAHGALPKPPTEWGVESPRRFGLHQPAEPDPELGVAWSQCSRASALRLSSPPGKGKVPVE